MKKKIGCAIISGGKAERLGGRDKSQITIKGKTILEMLAEELSGQEEIIMAGGNRAYAEKLSIDFAADLFPGCGPMGGIYSALKQSSSDALFVAACDMPFIKKSLVDYLIKEYETLGCPKALIAKAGGCLQPLCSIYGKTALQDLEAAIFADRLKLSLFALEEAYPVCDMPTKYYNMFVNINTAETLDLITLE